MTTMSVMLAVWGVLTTVFVGLLIYRGILGNHEADQLFLDRAEAALEQEQVDVLRRIHRLDPMIRWLGAASVALILFIGGLWLYRGLANPVME
jgi:hypothetical protein